MTRNEAFWEFDDTYRHRKRLGEEVGSVDEFYRRQLITTLNRFKVGSLPFAHAATRELAQWNHHRLGRSYCKVHPAIAQMLARTSIDIPCETFVSPPPVFEIRLPKSGQNPFQEFDGAPPLRSILVAMDLSHVPEVFRLHPSWKREFLGPERDLHLWMDFGESDDGYPTYQFLHILFADGQSIQDRLEMVTAQGLQTPIAPGTYFAGTEFQRSVLALTVATCFFIANQHELVAPDIAPRYIERYRKALSAGPEGSAEIGKLVSQSRPLGYGGRHLGREIQLPRDRVRYIEPPASETGKTWASRFAHVRSGHLRWQAYGPRDNPQHKLLFIAPTMVRPDLPLPVANQRFVLPDRVA